MSSTGSPSGFAARKQALTLYLTPGFEPYGDLLATLGPHTTSVGCLTSNAWLTWIPAYFPNLSAGLSKTLGVAAESVRRMRQDGPMPDLPAYLRPFVLEFEGDRKGGWSESERSTSTARRDCANGCDPVRSRGSWTR